MAGYELSIPVVFKFVLQGRVEVGEGGGCDWDREKMQTTIIEQQ